MTDLTVGEIKRLLQGHCPGLLHELVPHAKREGRLLSAPNPTRAGDTAGSFKIWPNGAWSEYDEAGDGRSGQMAGDLIGLIAYVNHYAPKSAEGRRFAVQWAKQRLGLAQADRRTIARVKRQAGFAAKRARDDEQRQRERKMKRAFEIWLESKPLRVDPPDPVVIYLRGRGIDIARVPGHAPSLRYHPNLTHWSPEQTRTEPWNGPAMVARVIDATGALKAVHCTWLGIGPARDAKGRAPLRNPKLMLGPVAGGFVPLCLGPSMLTMPEAIAQGVCEPLILCEGIETGCAEVLGCLDEATSSASASSSGAEGEVRAAVAPGARVWACLSLSNIGNAPVDLGCLSAIVVSVENDLKPQAVKQRDAVLAALEARTPAGTPVLTKHVHAGGDSADLLGGAKEQTHGGEE